MAEPLVDDFPRAADPYRRELLAHCYRMLGSVHEAEDLVQETYLRAWKAYSGFEGRSSLRTWLHKIATTACLTALESRNRRPLPTGLGGPSSTPEETLVERTEVPWLEPLPDVMIGADATDGTDPATVVTSRESVRLALIAALQHLPPRQRAVLILRDVLRWRATEVAEAVGISTAAVNSILQRAREQLAKTAPSTETVTEPVTTAQRRLLDQYVTAFENYDIPALVTLFTDEAVWEMPPYPTWYRGPETIGRLIAAQCPAEAPGDLKLVATGANGQPAFGMYLRDPATGVFHAFGIHVLTMAGPAVDHVAVFFDTTLFAGFGLPAEIAGPGARDVTEGAAGAGRRDGAGGRSGGEAAMR